MNAAVRGVYYPHIDGIRAFAVLSVLCYHVFPQLCPGGFIGVDVFFVLSGFLITQGIDRDLQTGQFSVARFYARRIRRIFPAYAALIFLVLLAGCVLYYGEDLIHLVGTACSSTLFYSNIYFRYHSGYFDPQVHNNPLLNMWSLSVEEQFYVFFPLMLACFHRCLRRWLTAALGVAFLISLAWSCYKVQGGHGMEGAFYGLPSRAWELLAGSLLAVSPYRLKGRAPWIGMLALLLLGSQFFLYQSQMPFPGLAALGPVLCAFLLLQYGHRGWSRSILEHPGVVFVGKISYSLYLYHWPVLVFARYVAGTAANTWILGGAVILLSLTLSILSWRWVETPIRLTRWTPRRYFLLAGAGLAALLLLLGAARVLGGYERRHPLLENSQEYWRGTAASSYPQPDWGGDTQGGTSALVMLGNDEKPCYMLWGDSHAMSLSPGFDAFSQESGINGLYVGRRHLLMDAATSSSLPENDLHLEEVLAWLQVHPEIRTIILSNRWAVRAQGFTNEDGVLPQMHYQAPYINTDSTPASAFETGLTRLCETLRAMGKQIILVSPIPEQRETVEVKMHKARLAGIDWRRLIVSQEEYVQRQKEALEVLRKLEHRGWVRVLWVDAFFFPQGRSRSLLEDGYSLYVDDDHLSPTGARLLLRYLAPQLRELLKEECE